MRPDLKLIYMTAGGAIIGLMIGFLCAYWLWFDWMESLVLIMLATICGGLAGYRLWENEKNPDLPSGDAGE
jgi:hypothetical protein